MSTTKNKNNFSILFYKVLFIVMTLIIILFPTRIGYAEELDGSKNYTEIIDVREYINKNILIHVDGGIIEDVYFQKSDGTYYDINGYSSRTEKGIIFGNYWYTDNLTTSSNGLSPDEKYQNIKIIISSANDDYQVNVSDGSEKPFDFTSIDLQNGNHISLDIGEGKIENYHEIKVHLNEGKEYFYYFRGDVEADLISPSGEIIKHHDKLNASGSADSDFFIAGNSGIYTLKFNGRLSTLKFYPVTERVSDIKNVYLPIKLQNINFPSKSYLFKSQPNKALSFEANITYNTKYKDNYSEINIEDYKKELKRSLDSSQPDVEVVTNNNIDTLYIYPNASTVFYQSEMNEPNSIAKAITFEKNLRYYPIDLTVDFFGKQAKPITGKYAKDRIQETSNKTSEDSKVGDPVDVSTGAFLDKKQILSYSGKNPLLLKMQYNSIANDSKSLGGGWTHNFETWITESDNEITVYWNPNLKTKFENTDGKWTPTNQKDSYFELIKLEDESYQIKNRRTQETFLFNSKGKLIEKKDKHGLSTFFEYNEDNNLVVVKNTKGQEFSFTYDSNDKLTSVKDHTGREATFSYDTKNLLTSMTNPSGNAMAVKYINLGTTSNPNYKIKTISYDDIAIIENEYDSYGRVINQKDSLDHETNFDYDDYSEEGFVTTKVTDRRGFTETYYHDSNSQLLKKTNKKGNTQTFTYDELGNRVSETDFKGNKTTYEYNNLGFVTKEIHRDGTYKNYAYDSTGNLIGITNENGKTLTNTYTDNNLLESVSDFNGHKTVYQYDKFGNPTEIIDPKGNKTVYEYDENGYLISSIDKEGNKTTYQNDLLGRVEKTILPNGSTTQYKYDNLGNIIEIIDSNGSVTKYRYDVLSNLIESTDKLGRITTYQYDDNGWLSSKAIGERTVSYKYDAEGNLIEEKNDTSSIKYEYDENGQLIKTVYPEGETVEYQRDENGNVIKEKNAKGTIVYTYDEMDRNISVKNASGNTTTYSYDNTGLLTKESSPSGNEIRYSYDPMGNLLSITDGNGHITTNEYDSTNNLVKTINARGKETTYAYNKNGQLIQSINALGQSNKIQYNENGNIFKEINANGETVYQYEYDSLGNLIKKTDGLGHTITFNYDALGNLLETYDGKGNLVEKNTYNEYNEVSSSIDGLERKATYQYDTRGNIISFIDPLERVITYNYDNSNRLINMIDPNQKSADATYTEAGLISSYKDTNGNLTTNVYSPTDKLISETNATGNKIQYEYNADDLISKYTNARGNTASYSYDKAGNLTRITEGETIIEFTYSETNQIKEIKETGKGTIERLYDDLDRVIQYKDEYGNIIQYEYDTRGYLNKIIYPGNLVVTYEHDVMGNLIKVTDWNGNVTTYQYDENNRLIQTVKPDGFVEKKTYDKAGQLVHLKITNKNGETIRSTSYEYDLAGNIIKENDISYSYDLLDRLIEENSNRYSYDPAGNLLESVIWRNDNSYKDTYQYGEDNRLISINGQNTIFDKDGNLIEFEIDGNIYQADYDQRNRLSKIGDTEYRYNAEDTRTAIVENGVETRLVVDVESSDLSRVLMETDESGNPIKYYVYGLGLINEYGADAKSEAKIYHFDYRGSTIAQTDLDGKIIGEVSYNAYGEIVSKDDTVQTRFLFNGRDGVQTDSNGLYYMRARYYSPDLKRFINRDIVVGNISESQTLNRYAYVNGNPISYIDPFGLSRDPASTSFWGKVGNWVNTGLDYLQEGLDVAGFIPGVGAVPDGANAVIYTFRGDFGNAGLSALAMVPGWGDGIKAGTKVGKLVKYTDESNFIIFNKTHANALPKPRGKGPNGGNLQSHHGLQQGWAKDNLSQYGYNAKLAPTITIETGKGLPHTIITNAQNTRRDVRVSSGQGKWSSSLQQELQYIVDDLTEAGFSRTTIEEVLTQQYQMLDKLNVPYRRVDY